MKIQKLVKTKLNDYVKSTMKDQTSNLLAKKAFIFIKSSLKTISGPYCIFKYGIFLYCKSR